MKKIPGTLPVYMISGDEDPVGDYGKGVRKAYQAMKDAGIEDITLKIYPGDRHELVNETDRMTVLEDIENWLKLHLVR